LAGNAFGLQVELSPPFHFKRRRLGGFGLVVDDDLDERRRRHRASWPMIVARGLISADSMWARRFGESPIVPAEGGGFLFFTGLLLRPRPGLFVRLSDAGNRRNRELLVDEVVVLDAARFTPLVLRLQPLPHAPEVLCGGEVATLSVHRAGARVTRDDISDHVHVARRHLAFYDAAYFASKKSRPTTKYRRSIENVVADRCDIDGVLHVSEIDSAQGRVRTDAVVMDASGVGVMNAAGVERFEVHQQVHVDVRFDGRAVTVHVDEPALQAGARRVQEKLSALLGADAVATGQGAVWYLTRLISLHPPGEPFFFTKPWALAQCPTGWSILIEGARDAAGRYDVMRGVVAGDRFHATPAVFSLPAPTAFSLPVGTPLATLWALPRDLSAPRANVDVIDLFG
jgi:hypothetical protein